MPTRTKRALWASDTTSVKLLNARFEAMSPAEKRKAIAADVLERLKRRRLKPTPGKWVAIPLAVYRRKVRNGERNLQTILRKRNAPVCNTCALGGVMCSLAAWQNAIDIQTFEGGREDSAGIGFYAAQSRLNAIFGHDQLALIEYTFERGAGQLRTFDLTSEQLTAAEAFWGRYPTPRALFKAIFTSILAHPEGLFAP